MATTTFTNTTDYGPADEIYSNITISGITVGDVTNMRFEIDWTPDGDECGSDASSSSCNIIDPDSSTSLQMFSYGSLNGGEARTSISNKTSSFPSNFNGTWRFFLNDEDYTECNQVTETRIIVTYTAAATTTNAPFLMFVD